MSTGFVISAVSAVLQHFLANALSNVSAIFGTVALSSKAPDLVQQEISTGTSLQNQVNLFLHQVTHNPGWRNVALPSLGSNGTTLLSNPPLALNIHYLLTVYGSRDWRGRRAVRHSDVAPFPRHRPRRHHHRARRTAGKPVLTAGSVPPASPISWTDRSHAVAAQSRRNGLALDRAESRLPADFPFQASVVLIEAETPLSLAFPGPQPVYRGQRNSAVAAVPGNAPRPAACRRRGRHGDGHRRVSEKRDPDRADLSASRRSARHPDDQYYRQFGAVCRPAGQRGQSFPAGIYTLAANITDAGGNVTQTTNSLPFAVAPVLQLTSLPVAQSATQTTVTATFSPAARPNQKVSLAIGSQSARPAFKTNQTTLTFTFAPPLTPGKQLARLLVDGSPSQVIVNWPTTPGGIPTFDQSFWVTI